MLNEGNKSRDVGIEVIAYTVDKKQICVTYTLERYIVDGQGGKHFMADYTWVTPNTVTVDEDQAEIDCSAANPVPGE